MLLRLAPLVLGGLLLSACAGAMGEGDREPWPIIVLEDPAETTLVDDEFDRASLVYPGSLEASEGAGETFRLYSTADDLDAVLSYYEELGLALTDVEGLSHVAIVRGGGHLVFVTVRQEAERVVIQISDIKVA